LAHVTRFSPDRRRRCRLVPLVRTIGKGAPVNGTAAPLSVVGLFLHADIVVKGVMLLLLAASVWSWAVIVEKLWSLARASHNARDHEARVLAAHSPQELLAAAGRTELGDPTALVIAAGWAEANAPTQDLRETTVERRDRVERAMRLALNAELRRLETRLPFLASLASAAPFIGLFGTVRQFLGDRRRKQHEHRDGGAGHRRGAVRHRNGARRRDPGALCWPHAGSDRALQHAPFWQPIGGLRWSLAAQPWLPTTPPCWRRSATG
jgi:hypothetical protein